MSKLIKPNYVTRRFWVERNGFASIDRVAKKLSGYLKNIDRNNDAVLSRLCHQNNA